MKTAWEIIMVTSNIALLDPQLEISTSTYGDSLNG